MKSPMTKLKTLAVAGIATAAMGLAALPAQAATEACTNSITSSAKESFGIKQAKEEPIPAPVAGADPSAPAAPSLLLGAVAQRYPWDGKIDVQYKAKNVPAGRKITVTVTLPDGKSASETYDCKNGENTVAFDAAGKFGEGQFKGAQVKLSLSE